MNLRSIYRLLTMITLALAIACANDDTKVIYKGGTTPVLSVSDTSSLVLSKANENYSSLQFNWTYPNYQFSNGVSTQDVFYTLEFDSVGANFASPGTVSFTNVLNNTFSVKDLNNALGSLSYKDYVKHNFEFRIKATMASGSAPVYSNVIKVKITTYLDVVYPVPDNLYITGSATPGGWQKGASGETVPPGQQFTKVNSYLFQIDALQLTFNGTADSDNGFLFLPVYGSWSAKYGFTGAKHGNNGSGDYFTPNGSDFAPPTVSGNYQIQVNFKTGKYSMTKL